MPWRRAGRAERGMRPGTGAAALDLGMETTRVGRKRAVGARAGAFRPAEPRMMFAGRNLGDPARQPDRLSAGTIADGPEARPDTSAKMAIAFPARRAPCARDWADASDA